MAIDYFDPSPLPALTYNSFCPTGKGGGRDNSCGRGGGKSAGKGAAKGKATAKGKAVAKKTTVKKAPAKKAAAKSPQAAAKDYRNSLAGPLTKHATGKSTKSILTSAGVGSVFTGAGVNAHRTSVDASHSSIHKKLTQAGWKRTSTGKTNHNENQSVYSYPDHDKTLVVTGTARRNNIVSGTSAKPKPAKAKPTPKGAKVVKQPTPADFGKTGRRRKQDPNKSDFRQPKGMGHFDRRHRGEID